MPSSLTEFWGWCAECERWFYCGHGDHEAAAASTCPVCLSAPDELDVRRVEHAPPASGPTATRPHGRVLARAAPQVLRALSCTALRQHELAIAAWPDEGRGGTPHRGTSGQRW